MKANCRHWVISMAIAILLWSFSAEPVSAQAPNRFFLNFSDTHLIYNIPDNATMVNAAGSLLSMDRDWEVKQLKPYLFHVRMKFWKGFFWKVDTKLKRVYKVIEGTFGSLGGSEKVLKGVKVVVEDGDNERAPARYFILRFSSSYLSFEPATGNMQISAGGFVISYGGGWDVKKVKRTIYHLRLETWKNLYWKVDTRNMKAYGVKGGEFGSMSGSESPLNVRVTVFKPRSVTSKLAGIEQDPGTTYNKEDRHSKSDTAGVFGIMEDFELVNVKRVRRPISDWIESEKALYRDLLRHDSYDVLVVPFQVQGYAIDRIGRSLMTRYLSHRIESVTNLKVPSPTLVARALGERERVFDEREVYQLANDLKVKILIRGYVGHNRDEKLKLTLLVQVRDEDSVFSYKTKVTKIEWKDIPFSDEHLPSEAFRDYLDEIVSKLPVSESKKFKVVFYKRAEKSSLPENILAMVRTEPESPVLGSYYLQLLGMLYPEDTTSLYPDDTTEREHFFERSLVALSGVSPKSPDYALLKARAYFYLHRRPAALAVLEKSPKGPAEKALAALLDGNIVELERWADEIESPLTRLLAQIELNDLRMSYGYNPSMEHIEKITDDLPDWKMIITHRIEGKDRWTRQSNLMVKQKLDEAFPIPGFTAESLAMSNVVVGKDLFEDEDIEFSVYNHYRRLLSGQGEKFCCSNDSWHPVERDYLDLLYAIGEANLLQKIRFLVFAQDLKEKAVETLNRYEMLYRGHIKLTYLKVVTLRGLSRKKRGQVRVNIEKAIKENEYNVCYWSQGQSRIASNTCGSESFYNGDYPKRWYWPNSLSVSDRKEMKANLFGIDLSLLDDNIKHYLNNLALSLLYANDSFLSLKVYHKKLLDLEMYKEADMLLKSNQGRFVGHPDRIAYLSKDMEKKGDMDGAIRLYEEAIALTPEVWKPYLELGELYVKQGNFKKALATFQKYLLFNEGERVNRVALSNYAYEAGFKLMWHGAIDEAIPLLRLSASYETGSSAEMFSSAFLSLIERDYNRAAYYFLQCAKRYNDNTAHMLYILLLRIMGYQKESQLLFDSLDIQQHSRQIWSAAFVWHRLEGATDEGQRQWLLERHKTQKVTVADAGRYILMTHMIDRYPNRHLAELIEEISWKIASPDRKPQVRRKSRFHLAWFADGYYALRMGDFAKALGVFREKFPFFSKRTYRLYSYAFPYIAWSSVKSGNLSEFENHLRAYKSKFGEDFDYHLSKAFISGGKGHHEKAIRHLKAAFYRLPPTRSRPFFARYQIVEASEWLYEDTGYEEYRTLALEWAKTYQRIYPIYAWAYAVEAKYTDSLSDRLRALALTLYLDKRSERIADFSGIEKDKALEWLKRNNPFLDSGIVESAKEVSKCLYSDSIEAPCSGLRVYSDGLHTALPPSGGVSG